MNQNCEPKTYACLNCTIILCSHQVENQSTTMAKVDVTGDKSSWIPFPGNNIIIHILECVNQ